LAVEEQRKVVVFSEYERMTFLASQELTKLRIPWVSLHGNVPGRKRGDLMTRFRNDPDCKAFLSTDAGGVGLNLQAASAVVNFEPPWNPARLEQRIGRVHRLGQAQPVQVIHLLTEDSIEERVWETLRLKKALFSGLFDSTTDEVSFEKLGRRSMMQVVKEVFCDQAGQPMPVSSAQAQATRGIEEAERSRMAEPLPVSIPVPAVEGVTQAGVAASQLATEGGGASAESHPRPLAPAPVEAAAKLLEAGLNFLESIVPPPAGGARPTVRFEAIERSLAALFQPDAKTQRPTLTLPLPEGFSTERLAGVIGGLLSKFAGSA
jgi:superfamily II DNA/RNA helicase